LIEIEKCFKKCKETPKLPTLKKKTGSGGRGLQWRQIMGHFTKKNLTTHKQKLK